MFPFIFGMHCSWPEYQLLGFESNKIDWTFIFEKIISILRNVWILTSRWNNTSDYGAFLSHIYGNWEGKLETHLKMFNFMAFWIQLT